MWQPPVLHIPFPELAGSGAQQMRSRALGGGKAERHPILQLIAKTVSPARLIERRAGPEPTGNRLIEQPAIEQNVHGAIRGADLHGAQQRLPLRIHLRQHLIEPVTITGDKGAGLLVRGGLPQQDHAFKTLARQEVDVHLQCRTGIQSRSRFTGQGMAAGQRRRRRRVATESEELGAIGGPACLLATEIEEGHAAREGGIPRVLCQHGARAVIQLAGDKGGTDGAIGAQHPLHVTGHRQAAGLIRQVVQRQTRDLDGVRDRDKLQQFAVDAVGLVLEAAVTIAMTGNIGSTIPNGLRGRAPQFQGLFIAQVDGFTGRIRHRII